MTITVITIIIRDYPRWIGLTMKFIDHHRGNPQAYLKVPSPSGSMEWETGIPVNVKEEDRITKIAFQRAGT